MITCPICHAENHHLAVTCPSCGCFLQQRIENLDLFSTIGHLIESPKKTFHTIAIARHKNFMIILSALSGWMIIFTLFWLLHAGEYAQSFLNLLVAGMVTGPFLGIVLNAFIALLLALGSSLFRARITFKNSLALTAYSFLPLIITFVFIYPVIFLTFGIYFFTESPSPSFLKPFSYQALSYLQYGLSAWAIYLLLLGIKVTSNATWPVTIIIWCATCGITTFLLYILCRIVLP